MAQVQRLYGCIRLLLPGVQIACRPELPLFPGRKDYVSVAVRDHMELAITADGFYRFLDLREEEI